MEHYRLERARNSLHCQISSPYKAQATIDQRQTPGSPFGLSGVFYCLAHAPSSISNLRPTAKSRAAPASYDKHRYASASPSIYSQSKRFSAFQRPDLSALPPTNKEHCSIFLTIAPYIKWLRRETIWSKGDPSAKNTSLRSMAKRRREKALLFQTKMFNARYLKAKLVKRDSSAVAQSVVLPLLHFSEVRSNH